MDIVAALGMASSILQVVDFSIKLLSASNDILKTGSTVHNSNFKRAADDLSNLHDELKSSLDLSDNASNTYSKDEQEIKKYADESSRIAGELLAGLSTVKFSDEHETRETHHEAVKTKWKKQYLDETNAHLRDIRDALESRVLVSMKRKSDMTTLRENSRFLSFDLERQKIIEAILIDKDAVHGSVPDKTASEKLRWQFHQRNTLAERMHLAPVMIEDSHRHALLNRLKFRGMFDRHESIAPRHRKTFDWVLTQSNSNNELPQWLRTGSGIFWISGRAGSGKSTLMKFLEHDPRTINDLRIWAGSDTLKITSFYLWRAGIGLQQSLMGILRSTLHDLVKSYPVLGQYLFPEWYETPTSRDDQSSFTLDELKEAFCRLLAQDALKVVMFVDGLDESEASTSASAELVNLFQVAVSSGSVKIILSSRPLEPFESAFEKAPTLRLHDFTSEDIKTYVHDRLGRHHRAVQLARLVPVSSRALLEEIVRTASGDFLWAKLVVQCLLRDFQNSDTITDLRHRFRGLPKDIENLLDHMLRSIDPECWLQSSRLFQLVRRTKEAAIFSEDEKFGGLILLYADTCAENKPRSQEITSIGELAVRCDEMSIRLDVLCAGLVEIRLRQDQIVDVEHLHRIVVDYLEQPSIWKKIVSVTEDGPEFDANLNLLKATVGVSRIKNYKPQLKRSLPRSLLCYALDFARKVDPANRHDAVMLLDELDTDCMGAPSHYSMLYKAARAGLAFYLREKLASHGADYFQRHKNLLLNYACHPTSQKLVRARNSPEIIDFLVGLMDADPNHKVKGFSLWQDTLQEVCLHLDYDDGTSEDEGDGIIYTIRSLLLNGADPNAFIGRAEGQHYMDTAKEDHTWRYSALFIIRRAFFADTAWQDNEIELLDPLCYSHSSDTGSKHQQQVQDLAKIPLEVREEVVNLLQKRGARERVWRRMNCNNNDNNNNNINNKRDAHDDDDDEKHQWEQVYPRDHKRILRNKRFFDELSCDERFLLLPPLSSAGKIITVPTSNTSTSTSTSLTVSGCTGRSIAILKDVGRSVGKSERKTTRDVEESKKKKKKKNTTTKENDAFKKCTTTTTSIVGRRGRLKRLMTWKR